MRKAFKYILLLLSAIHSSCTDQGDPKKYALSNTTSYTIEVIRFDWLGNSDTTLISRNDFKIMYEEVPPYDEGPFGVYDSLSIHFEDSKILTYIPPKSGFECIDSIKNPFCPYSNYTYVENVCTFEIDSLEYQKAK